MISNLSAFIEKHITGRSALFKNDLERSGPLLSKRIDGRSVLVIGGAGTIGAAFIKALLHFRPARMVVVDFNENGLTELVRDLRSSLEYHIPEQFLTYPIDFGDAVFEKMLRREGPFDIVANFAAHKHVRSEKDPYSIEAMLNNNVFKTKRLLDLLSAAAPERFFCVSTDKAANPVNVMGASKKWMEEVILAYAHTIPVITARFANVAFSNGSLPAGFLERLLKRQPLSAPSDVRRYFVSPEEAGQLCLLACILGAPGEIFYPKLHPVDDALSFSEIAEKLLSEMGFQTEICHTEQEAREKAAAMTPETRAWPVYFFQSDTSGEKALEAFFTENEILDEQRFESIGVILPDTAQHDGGRLMHIETLTAELKALLERDSVTKQAIIELMQQIIPGFQHMETGKNLDQKM